MSEIRPPIVAVMGHIDHGKSTLLDYIRKSNVAEKEAGGITQHVSAYEIEHAKEDGTKARITFLDTPGHEAFRGIRSRGAHAADIAILVVSAEEGVKPQTIEAYQEIKQSEVPFLVAITKIDRPSANIDRTKQSLAENDIYVEGYGGDVPVVAISAKTGEGIDDLLSMILLIAELENFTGDHGKWGYGIIIESKRDPKRGITATGVIKDGTVKKGMVAASIGTTAPLRFILDAEGKQVDELSFSSPIQIIGWNELPPVGAIFEVFDDKQEAVFYAESELAKKTHNKTEEKIDENLTILPLIIKADTVGSLEALTYELKKLNRERIVPKIVSSGVGTVSENDVRSALTTPGTMILAFQTRIDAQASALAERSGISIEEFDIIYKITERVTDLLLEREPRIEVEETTGSAKVLRLFSTTKDKHVLGARVLSGTFEVGGTIKIIRRDVEIGRGKTRELQQNKVQTDRVTEENEFGAMIESKMSIAPGDILEQIAKVTK